MGPAVAAAVGPAVAAAIAQEVRPAVMAAVGPAVAAAMAQEVRPAVASEVGPAVAAAMAREVRPAVASEVGPAVAAAMALEVGPAVMAAVGPAVAAAMASVHNTIARGCNAAVVGIAGKRLMALNDAQGQAPAPGVFPLSTDELISWNQLSKHEPDVWTRVYRLLQHYTLINPRTNAPFISAGAALPQQPGGQSGIAQLRVRVAALQGHIIL